MPRTIIFTMTDRFVGVLLLVYLALVNAGNDAKVCSGIQQLSGTFGSFKTPTVPNDTNCTYVVTVRVEHTIRLTFARAVGGKCDEKPMLYDGSDTSAKQLVTKCVGGRVEPVMTTGNVVTIVMAAGVQGGTEVTYNAMFKREYLTHGGELTPGESAAAMGTLSSYTVIPPEGKLTELLIDVMSINEGSRSSCQDQNTVKIYDLNRTYVTTLCNSAATVSVYVLYGVILELDLTVNPNDVVRGFHAYFSAVGACKNEYSADKGDITVGITPTPIGRHCTYTITPSDSHFIVLDIVSLDIKGNDKPGCEKQNSLQIYDLESTHVASLCGNPADNVARYVLPGVILVMDLGVDKQNAYAGRFRATYTTQENDVCSDVIELTNSSGKIESPGYPKGYYNAKNCTYRITVSADYFVRLTFGAFNVDKSVNCAGDSVQVYDGNNTSTQPMVVCSPTKEIFKSSGNVMTLVFKTNTERYGPGWIAYYTSACHHTYKATKGELQPYSNPVPMGTYCTYTIIPPKGKFIELAIDKVEISFDKKCRNGLEIEQSGDNGVICGDWEDDELGRYLMPSIFMTLDLSADPHETRGLGFHATYVTRDNDVCTDVYHTKGYHGSITSINYPNTYFNHKTCQYRITTQPPYRVRLWFEKFFIEEAEHGACKYDRLTIHDGANDTVTEVETLCGFQGNERKFLTTANEMFVVFKTDHARVETGWMAKFHSVRSTKHTNENGTLTPGNTPPPMGTVTQHVITTPPGKYTEIVVEMVDVSMGVNCENALKISGLDDVIHLWGKLPGPTVAVYLIKSPTIELDLTVNPGLKPAQGYRVSYTTKEKDECSKMQIFNDTSGYFSSQNYPGNYYNSAKCQYRIIVTKGHVIRVSVQGMATTLCQRDVLSIHDAADPDNVTTTIQPCTGENVTEFVSSSNDICITFLTGNVSTDKGWNVTYSEECAVGRFGDNCSRACHCEVDDECDSDGYCDGACHHRFVGDTCQQTCPSGRFNVSHNCRGMCHCGNGDNACRVTDGVCVVGKCAGHFIGSNCQDCVDGYYGTTCDKTCDCKGEKCERKDGSCGACVGDKCKPTPKCPHTRYGDRCTKPCHCINSQPCHVTTGICKDGCAVGYRGSDCSLGCQLNRYGLNCMKKCYCATNTKCHGVTGKCPGACRAGYGGSTCSLLNGTAERLGSISMITWFSIILCIIFLCERLST